VPTQESLTASRPSLERRILAGLDASPSRIPVVLGDFRTGRTQLLYRLRDRIGRTQCQHIDLERSATTPERFYNAIVNTMRGSINVAVTSGAINPVTGNAMQANLNGRAGNVIDQPGTSSGTNAAAIETAYQLF